MSVRVMSAVWSNGPTDSTQRFVLLALADSASDDGGNAYPSINKLAKKCALSERTVIRALDGLTNDGYLIRYRRKDTSNMYQIVISKLVSDNLSLTQVTERHQSHDILSLTGVTNCHSTSDTVSHDPSIRHPIKHQGKQAASPPSPIVISQSIDRTPKGFQSTNGYRPPAEPEPPQKSQRPEAERQAIGHLINAIVDVTGKSAKLNPDVIEFAEELHPLGYNADQIRRAYSRNQTTGWNWFTNHWKGRDKNDMPTVKDIRETVAAATQEKKQVKKMSQVDLALAAIQQQRGAQ